MKRTYISPEIKTHKLQSLQLLAGSDPTGAGNTDIGGGNGTADEQNKPTDTMNDDEFGDMG